MNEKYRISFYLFSVVDDVNQPIILVKDSTVQRLQAVHCYPIISGLSNTNKHYQESAVNRDAKPADLTFDILGLHHLQRSEES